MRAQSCQHVRAGGVALSNSAHFAWAWAGVTEGPRGRPDFSAPQQVTGDYQSVPLPRASLHIIVYCVSSVNLRHHNPIMGSVLAEPTISIPNLQRSKWAASPPPPAQSKECRTPKNTRQSLHSVRAFRGLFKILKFNAFCQLNSKYSWVVN